MVPLVVRPAAQANQLVQMLHQLGHAPLCCPLLETRPGCDLPHLGDMLREADLVIAVSMHAVHFAHYFLLQTGQTCHILITLQSARRVRMPLPRRASRPCARPIPAVKGCWPCLRCKG